MNLAAGITRQALAEDRERERAQLAAQARTCHGSITT